MIKMTINKKDFDRLLKKLDAEEQGEVIKKSLFQSALFINNWIKQNRLSGPRPIYLGVVTGRLRSSITAAQTEKVGNSYIAKIGTNVEYARRHEYGDVALGITHKKGKGIPSRPYMRPAIEDRQNIESVKEDLRRNIEEFLRAK